MPIGSLPSDLSAFDASGNLRPGYGKSFGHEPSPPDAVSARGRSIERVHASFVGIGEDLTGHERAVECENVRTLRPSEVYSSMIAEKLLAGWTMLNENCPRSESIPPADRLACLLTSASAACSKQPNVPNPSLLFQPSSAEGAKCQ
jgi:hypothetical protein